MHIRRVFSAAAAALLLSVSLQSVSVASQAAEDPTPGTAASEAGTDPSTLSAAAATTGLTLQVNERGRISRSVDAAVGGDDLQIRKPAGATVRAAYLAYASRGFSQVPITRPIVLNGSPVPITNEVANGISSYNYFADVTEHVKNLLDTAAAGPVTVPVTEGDAYYTEGEILTVIFEDPNVTSDRTVSVLYGALAPTGDTYRIDLARPIDLADPHTHMEMSLGISFSYQSGGVQQYSSVDVNGQRLSTSAGGEDDGLSGNGYLITAGGEGDSSSNPASPGATPTGPRSDDELYDLRPFVQTGDESLTVTTSNPSLDDNVFLAVLEMNPPVTVIDTNQGTLPISPSIQSAPIGESARFEVGSLFGGPDMFNGRANVISGPNAGRPFTFTCAGNCLFGGPSSWTYTPEAGGTIGEDVLEIWIDTNDNEVRDVDEEYGIARIRWTRAVHSAGLGDSYSSGEGLDPYDAGTDDDWGASRNQCHRSSHAYHRAAQPNGYKAPLPDYVGGATDTQVAFIACSGATTHNVLSGGAAQYTEPGSQLDQGRLDARTDLVTLSIGGNDIGFSDILKLCYRKDCTKDTTKVDGVPVADWADGRVQSLTDQVVPVLAQIKANAPQATVALFGYPRLFPTDPESQQCLRLRKLGSATMDWLNATATQVDQQMRLAAAKAGVHFISVQDRFTGHAVCGPDGEWLFGPTWPNLADIGHKQIVGTGSFHPNHDGQAAYAEALNDFLTGYSTDDLSDAGLPLNPLPTSADARTLAMEETNVTGLSDLGSLYVAGDPTQPDSECLGENVVRFPGMARIAGEGFAPGSTVQLTWEATDPTSAPVSLGTITVDERGSFQEVLAVPDAAVATEALVTASGDGAAGVRLVLLGTVVVSGGCEAGFAFDGFFAPVNNQPSVNAMQAGRSVPVKFSLGGDRGLDVFAEGSPSSVQVSCSDSAPVDEVEQTTTAGESQLGYDPGLDRYTYVWKTKSEWAGTCRRFAVEFIDGTTADALFQFR